MAAPLINNSVVNDASLSAIKRMDPDAEDILASSGHVTLYTMTVEQQQWQRKGVEGSLFLLKRKSLPRFQLLVLNKMTTENYVDDVVPGLDFEVNPPYLMYTKGNNEVVGMWFYQQDDLFKIQEILARVKDTLLSAAAAETPVPAPAPPPAPPAAVAPAPAAPAPAHAHRHGGGDDDFWDKPINKANQAAAEAKAKQLVAGQGQQAGAAIQAMLQRPQQAAPPAPAPPAQNNLQHLLQAAYAKVPAAVAPAPQAADMQQQANGPRPAGLMPPSFFLQQPTAAPPAPPAAPVEPVAEQNALMKLFANAKKQPGAPPAPAPAPAAAPAVVPLPHAVVVAMPPHPLAQLGVIPNTDRNKVRVLLKRIAANDALVDMLAAEMRGVGIL